VTRWVLRKAGVKNWLVNTVMRMYEGVTIVVTTAAFDALA